MRSLHLNKINSEKINPMIVGTVHGWLWCRQSDLLLYITVGSYSM